MLKYITFNTGAEILCFLIAVICLSGNIKPVWKFFIPYLFITCATEFTGIYLKRLHHPNQWPYNILLIVQILFNSLVFMHLFNKFIKSKAIITGGLIALFIIYAYDIISHGFFIINELTYSSMCVLFVIYCFYYFYLLLNNDEYIVLKYSANFWWVSGSLLFYFGSTAVNLFREQLTPIVVADHNLTYFINIILDIILYGFWSYSFICKKWLTPTLKA